MLIREFVFNIVMATKPHPRSLILYLHEDIGNFYKVGACLREATAARSTKRWLTEFEGMALKIFQITSKVHNFFKY